MMGEKSEIDSAKRLWDAGTDTPRDIEPRSVVFGGFASRETVSRHTQKKKKKLEVSKKEYVKKKKGVTLICFYR